MRFGRVTILVLDALGIGAMEDVPEVRPRDMGANTLLHVLESREKGSPGLANLSGLGLGRLLSHRDLLPEAAKPGVLFGVCALGYPGADSYIAHQTMMGTDMTGVELEPFSKEEKAIADVLCRAGHRVRRALPDMPVLLVDGCMVLGDNLEADPGLNYNVTGSLDLTGFEHISRVARLVREHTSTSRIIAVGGRGLDAKGLVSNLRSGEGEVYGIDTPATGFYDREGLEVRHMGVKLDRSRQLPTLTASSGLPVTLIGKMSDVLECVEAEHLPAVQTEQVFSYILRTLRHKPKGLVAANVQEMDLSGHRQDASRWARVLERSDSGLGEILGALDEEDLLIVLGDHGNDPTVGHEFHTREYVPVLVFSPRLRNGGRLARGSTLANVGATAAEALGLPADSLETGSPFARLATRRK